MTGFTKLTFNIMDYEENKKMRKENWLKKNAYKSQLFHSTIMSANPDLGFYINVNGLEISKDFFSEEYEQITKAYFSFIKKLDEHYKNKS